MPPWLAASLENQGTPPPGKVIHGCLLWRGKKYVMQGMVTTNIRLRYLTAISNIRVTIVTISKYLLEAVLLNWRALSAFTSDFESNKSRQREVKRAEVLLPLRHRCRFRRGRRSIHLWIRIVSASTFNQFYLASGIQPTSFGECNKNDAQFHSHPTETIAG